MLRTSAIALSVLLVATAASLSFALSSVSDKGKWPKNWPKELEPLRNQSRTLSHNTEDMHAIPFANRGEFERAWPHILRMKSKEAPLILLSSPKASIRIHSPRTGGYAPVTSVAPKGIVYPPGKIGPPWPDDIKSASGALPEYVIYKEGKWMLCNVVKASDLDKFVMHRARIDIELFVDGEIVDLNRIPLPADTPIIDKRFKEHNK
ncbi:hypothetical protein ACFL1X_14715 [Candidatus Hydrogenedentota bacterium]